MKRTKIIALLNADTATDAVLVMGWVRTRRDAKGFSFIELNDGSCLGNIQIIVNESLPDYEMVKKANTGAALSVTGALTASQGAGQKWEVQADSVKIISLASDDYPLQKKRHSDEFLRTIAHLRPRTNKYGAMFRIRAELSYAIHTFFKNKGFYHIHSPIITGSDCEGAGEMFQLDFFGNKANLTVSGQLSAEMLALALGDVYTFGPTFRAENSNTARHAAEFWMIEPEMAFCDIFGNMDIGEELVKYLIDYALTHCRQDIDLFSKFVDKELMNRLETIRSSSFERLPYKEAIPILLASGRKFEYPVAFGKDLQSEHERYLTEEHFKKPVILYNYPKSIKPFYMRVNDDDETVAAMDILVPGIGEIVGGSQREERLDVLRARMKEMGMAEENYWWYLDSRKFGTVPHSGFGMGFERVLMLITGVSNIRDVIPFPRTPGNMEF